jgi:LacI family transcriptional regulator
MKSENAESTRPMIGDVARRAHRGLHRRAVTGSSSRSRFAHVTTLRREHGIDLSSSEQTLGGFSSEWGAQATRNLLSAGAVPDAILCGADVITLRALGVLDAHGLSVPEDTLITGFDNIGLSRHPRISITTVRQPVGGIARQTVDLVVDIIGNTTEHEVSSYSFQPELVVRRSTTKPGT